MKEWSIRNGVNGAKIDFLKKKKIEFLMILFQK